MQQTHVGSPIHLPSQDKLARSLSCHLVSDVSLLPWAPTAIVLRATWFNRLLTHTQAHMGFDVAR